MLGVQMFTLRKYTQTPDDLADILPRIREIGYRSIQVSAFGQIEPDVVADLCRQNDLEIGGTHVAWDRFRFDLDNVIEEHKLWRCRHAAIGLIPPKTYLSMEGLHRFLEELAPVAEKLAENGIDFSYHNHAHEFTHFDGKPWLAHLYNTATDDQLKAELDVHWIVAGGGDPVEWIERCGNRMPLLHLKDFALGSDHQRIFAAVGQGNMNFKAIVETARRYPIEYYFVEQDSCYGADELTCLKQSYDYLATLGLE